MVPPKLNFRSISRIESLESQEKHAPRNRFLRTLLWSNDNFNPGYNQKTLIRKRTSILDGVCFDYELLFHPVQCIFCKISQSSSEEKLVSPRAAGILTISDQLHYVWAAIFSGNSTRQKSTCLYQSWSLHILFDQYILSITGIKISSLESIVSTSGSCCISTPLVLRFRKKFLEL